MSDIDCDDAHSPSFPFSIASGHSCSGCSHSFGVRAFGRRRYCRHRWKIQEEQGMQHAETTRQLPSHASPSHVSHALVCGYTHTAHCTWPTDAPIKASPSSKIIHFTSVPDYARNEGECRSEHGSQARSGTGIGVPDPDSTIHTHIPI